VFYFNRKLPQKGLISSKERLFSRKNENPVQSVKREVGKWNS
jgi:hypothetical protein